MHILGVLLLLSLVSSCGKSNSNAGLPYEKEQIGLPVNGSNPDSLYRVRFSTLNPGVSGNNPSSATIKRQEDKSTAHLRFPGSTPNYMSHAYIYEGNRCPNASDDLNADGYIDIQEGNRVWGNVHTTLGTNLTKDNYPKIDPNRVFDIENRVIVVLGNLDINLYPESVAYTDGIVPDQLIPVACGVLSTNARIPVEPEVSVEPPAPTPRPTPTPTPTPVPDYPEDERDEDEQDGDEWYDRVEDWWRDRWD